MSTFENEDSLPELPVPSLSQTINQLLVAIKPLLSPEEYDELFYESTEFFNNDLVNLIQSHLQKASENPFQSCYLNSINDETNPGIYGELRGDILPRNPYLVLQEDPYSKFMNPPDQSQRAASLINSALKFIVNLRSDSLKPDVTPKNQNPLSMNCYKNLFGTTRVPDLHDSNYQHISIKKASNINDSNHIVVLSNNQYYKLKVLTDIPLDSPEETVQEIYFNDYELSNILAEIISETSKVTDVASINSAIGSLTTQSFNYWKLGRVELLRSNKHNLNAIDDALFVVVLDPNAPETDQDKTYCISHGTSKMSGANVQVGSCTSRWYDKMQLIVTQNSVAGISWESTSMDSTAILRFISDIYTDSILKLAKNINGIEYSLFGDKVKFSSGLVEKPSYEKLTFTLTPELQSLIHLSETRLADLINQHDYQTIKLKFNTELLKNFKLSIDSVLQVCLQITNYSLYGKLSNTLEPITTRKFKDARTELIAVTNDEIDELVKLFITNTSNAKKWTKFEECCRIHTKQYLDAMNGKGFERHLTSLLHITKRPKALEYLNYLNRNAGISKLPSFEEIKATYIPVLSNPILNKILSPELLVSNCGNPALYLFGIPPAVDQGFGIGYIIHRDKVLLTICSKFRQNERFLNTLVKIVNQIKTMLLSKSDFLLNTNTDNDYRKNELRKLRIEKELKNIDNSSPSTKHPIELSFESAALPIEKTKSDDFSIIAYADDEDSSDNQTGSSDFDHLGGYGYFDFGQADLRNIELHQNESVLNSHSNVTSKPHSSVQSRNHSSTNLPTLGNLHMSDIRQKMDMKEKIRDQLNKSMESLTTDDSEPEQKPESEIDTPAKSKKNIGRQLDLTNFQ